MFKVNNKDTRTTLVGNWHTVQINQLQAKNQEIKQKQKWILKTIKAKVCICNYDYVTPRRLTFLVTLRLCARFLLSLTNFISLNFFLHILKISGFLFSRDIFIIIIVAIIIIIIIIVIIIIIIIIIIISLLNVDAKNKKITIKKS